ncbi:MAG TPA: CoA-binding protein [Stellaceae bacterium]|nr:CoA-binding protein [Stellaceae bacterium]
MNHDTYSDDYLRDILHRVHTIAMVGASERPSRPSHYVMAFLQSKGYRVIPVNPRASVPEILGEKVYPSLAEIPVAIDMVDIFRRSEETPAVVDAAIAKGAKVVWMQLGVRNDAAAAKAEQAGVKVVMNRCPKIEFPRLFGALAQRSAG